MKTFFFTVICVILSIAFTSSCHENHENEQLYEISVLVNDSPNEVVELLKGIDVSALSESDRHLFDFLSVKANDKAYIIHTSDSLILDVLNWYRSHPADKLYPEALYYAGRVYSDLGDKPTALKYFKEALELIPEDICTGDLRFRILSQTGRLLTSLRLYNEGEKYIRQTLHTAEKNNDTLHIVQELQLLGCNLMRRGDFQQSMECFDHALRLSSALPDRSVAKSLMYKAMIKHKIGDDKSAVELIRGIPDRVHPASRNTANANAAYIYLAAGMPDSAMKYARRLIHSSLDAQKEVGYDVLLSIFAKNAIIPDSINKYLEDYREALEKAYNENESQLAIVQESLYNYGIHELERQRAEQARDRNRKYTYFALILLAIAISVILSMRFRRQKRIIELQTALNNIIRLKDNLRIENERLKRNVDSEFPVSPPTDMDLGFLSEESAEKKLRERLKSELLALAEKNNGEYNVPVEILQSEAFRKLQEKIEKGLILKGTDPLWDEIEKTVHASSPNFRKRLNLLTSGHLTPIDYHTALLLKCGIKPRYMAILEGRSHGSIVSRRESLGLKALDKKTGLAISDAVIQSL